MAFFDFLTGADEAQKASEKATRKAIGFAKEGQEKAAGAVTNYLAPGANYQPIQGRLYDLAGLNGGQAQQNAFGQFQESPEIAFQRQQGEESLLRARAAGGGLHSGATDAAAMTFGQGLASQSYGDYYNRLRDLYGSALGTATNLGGQLSGIYSNGGNTLANLQMQGGQKTAQYAGQRGSVFGDLLSQFAENAAKAAGAAYGAPGSTGSSYGR